MRSKIGISIAMLLGVAGAAQAADLPTANPAPPPPMPTLAACANPMQFVTTNCPLSWYGITIYGTVDMGVAWQSHGTPFNRVAPFGLEYLIQKNSNKALWSVAPSGLTQSFIGVKASEPLAPGWSFVFNWQLGFDPYSLQLANGPLSQEQNNGVPAALQNTNGDSSRAGQWYNGALYAGLSSTTFGTLTVGRQNSLTLDAVNAYDPMGGSYAFSVIGFSGATAGVGDTEDTRYSTAAKYHVDVGQFRAAALYAFGGYAWNNAATNAWELQAGADVFSGNYGKLAVDAIYSRVEDAVSTSPLSSAALATKYIGTVASTISDNTSFMAVAKYTYGPVNVYGGYENIYFAPPTTPQTTYTDIAGLLSLTPNISNTSYTTNQKVLQVFWAGAKYAINDNLDVTGAYYHYLQDNYGGPGSCSTYGSSSSHCAGTLDAVSAMVDWRFAAKFDVYAGVMFSEVNNGLANGYLFHTSWDPMAGLRFRF